MDEDAHDAGAVFDRETFEVEEDRRLAPFATRSSSSRGRRHTEAPDPWRTPFQRDRDRIIHSTAFRRLIGKTQVFVSDTGDHYRVRLTHSLEVSQIARSVARSLRLNEDLTEALALAHDLGHAPFGHVGGDVLDELMKNHGGFEHNRQALRILDRLEIKYPHFRGLNLSYEIRESILKHRRPFAGPDYADFHPEEGPCLEAQVVDYADGIAYNCHDIDDGLRAGLLIPAEVAMLTIWKDAETLARSKWPGAEGPILQHRIVATMINLLVRDLVHASAERLRSEKVITVEDVRRRRDDLIGPSAEMLSKERELRRFLYERFYTHYKVNRMRNRARELIARLFEAFLGHLELLPPRFQELSLTDGKERVIADYIAGMTDRYAQKEYGILFLPSPGSLDP